MHVEIWGHGGDQDAAGALLLELGEVELLLGVPAVGVGDEEAQAAFLRGFLGLDGDGSVEGVLGVNHDEPDRPAHAGLQLPGRIVGDVADLLDGALDLLAAGC